MNRLLYIGMFFAILSNASSAFAMSQLETANQHFQNRNNIKDISLAKGIYLDVIKNTKARLVDRQEALTKYGRLALFEGAVAADQFKNSEKERGKIFKTCAEVTEYLSPKKIKQEIAEYPYWRAVCLGLWLANINPVKAGIHAHRVTEIQNLVKIGQDKFSSHDGYGFDRIEAGLLFRSKALSIFKLYDPERALKVINAVLDKGTDIYMSFILKAEILQHLNRVPEARETLEQAIDALSERLHAKTLPADLVLENIIFLSNMKAFLIELNG